MCKNLIELIAVDLALNMWLSAGWLQGGNECPSGIRSPHVFVHLLHKTEAYLGRYACVAFTLSCCRHSPLLHRQVGACRSPSSPERDCHLPLCHCIFFITVVVTRRQQLAAPAGDDRIWERFDALSLNGLCHSRMPV